MDLDLVKDELMEKIDSTSDIAVEKVERYINLLEIYYKLDESVLELGTMITTENGSQKFTKPNPAIAEKNKINSSLIALGKDIGVNTENSKNPSHYNPEDLIR